MIYSLIRATPYDVIAYVCITVCPPKLKSSAKKSMLCYAERYCRKNSILKLYVGILIVVV